MYTYIPILPRELTVWELRRLCVDPARPDPVRTQSTSSRPNYHHISIYLSISLSLSLYIYIYTHTYVCIYIYI